MVEEKSGDDNSVEDKSVDNKAVGDKSVSEILDVGDIDPGCRRHRRHRTGGDDRA
jgi:hypothetical protein